MKMADNAMQTIYGLRDIGDFELIDLMHRIL